MKNNFQVDGIGIDIEHFAGLSQEEFIAQVVPGVPPRFGNEEKRTEWAKNAFELMQKRLGKRGHTEGQD